ncbi:MAG: sigma-70 family RNA polymerase sigma factor, partial [Actinobacteria bacterium]|nr:sigma-70 family RNA polymerase sigma factor [Actinomycetota bacterium]
LGLFGGAGAPVALVGGLAVALALGGAVVVTTTGTGPDADTPPTTSSQSQADPAPQDPVVALPDDVASLPPVDPSSVEGVVGGAGTVVDSLVDTVTEDGQIASISLTLTGTGTPGAHLSLQAAGQVYASTTVDANGNYAISASAIPGGLASLDLVQTVDREYLTGLLGGVLGLVDSVVDALIKPLGLSSNSGGIVINLVG